MNHHINWVVIILLLAVLILFAIGTCLESRSDQTELNPNVSVSIPGTAGKTQQQRITNVTGVKVEPHPSNKTSATLVVLTATKSSVAIIKDVLHRIILVRVTANDIVVHTDRPATDPAEIILESSDDCSDGSCSAVTVHLFLHSLDELH